MTKHVTICRTTSSAPKYTNWQRRIRLDELSCCSSSSWIFLPKSLQRTLPVAGHFGVLQDSFAILKNVQLFSNGSAGRNLSLATSVRRNSLGDEQRKCIEVIISRLSSISGFCLVVAHRLSTVWMSLLNVITSSRCCYGELFCFFFLRFGIFFLDSVLRGVLFRGRGRGRGRRRRRRRRRPTPDDLLPTTYYLLFTTYSLLLTLYYLLFTTYSLLPTLYYLLFTTYSLLPTLYYLLFTTYSLLPTLYYLLFTTYSLLPTLYYLLFTTYSLLPTLYYLLTTNC